MRVCKICGLIPRTAKEVNTLSSVFEVQCCGLYVRETGELATYNAWNLLMNKSENELLARAIRNTSPYENLKIIVGDEMYDLIERLLDNVST